MRVLQVQYDLTLAQSIELALKADGYTVVTTDYGDEALESIKAGNHDIVLLDTILRDMTGIIFLAKLEKSGLNIPVIMTTAVSSVEARVFALDAGADDFVSNAFHMDELKARIRAVYRRSTHHSIDIVSLGNLSVHLDTNVVMVRGKPIRLTPKQYDLLKVFMRHKDEVLNRSRIIGEMYDGNEKAIASRTLEVFISTLRKKIATVNGGIHYIESDGLDYILKEPTHPSKRQQRLAEEELLLRILDREGAQQRRSLISLSGFTSDVVNRCLKRLVARDFLYTGGNPKGCFYNLTREAMRHLGELSDKVVSTP